MPGTMPGADANNAQRKFGTFSELGYSTIEDPYIKKPDPDSRLKQRQFQTNNLRKGQTGDNWNQGPGRRIDTKVLFQNEKYEDPHAPERRYKMEQRKKMLTQDGFKYSHPNRKSSGLGNYHGSIGPVYVHQPEFNVLKKEEAPQKPKHEARQMQTQPAKKGSYGIPQTTFGVPQLAPGVNTGKIGAEFEHHTEPYDASRQVEKMERAKNSSKRQGAPFKPMSHSLDFFDAHPHVASSKVYTIETDKLPKVKDRKPEEKKEVKPFYPSKPPKVGYNRTLQKFPEYKEDPLNEKIRKQKEAAAAAKPKTDKPFRAVSNSYTGPTRSILFRHPGIHVL